MELIGISDIKKKDTLIYYRNQYEGTALFSLVKNKQASVKFQSTVEMLPTGHRDVTVELLEPIDYPLLPIIKILKNQLEKIDQQDF